MRLKMVVIGVAAGALAASSLLAAEPPARWERRAPGAGFESYLGLTAEQKAQLADEREAARPQMKALIEKMRESREKMQQALAVASPDPATVGAIAIESHRLQQQMRAQRDAAEKSLRAILTPEQQTKLDAIRALRGYGPGRMGPGRMGPMGEIGRMPFGPPPDGGPGDEPPPQE